MVTLTTCKAIQKYGQAWLTERCKAALNIDFSKCMVLNTSLQSKNKIEPYKSVIFFIFSN